MTASAPDDSILKAVQTVDAAVDAKQLTADAGTNLKRWLQEPQYAEYVPRLLELIQADEFGELDRLFWEVVRFGTGGRRGPMGSFGSATINERTIAESAHGLAMYLKQQTGESGGRAVVTCDTRLRSDEFSRLTATTLAADGLHVFLFDSHRSTPALSFAVRHLNCDIGVMISASHNPPSDNGFKAYWSTGGQVLPPHDQGIIDCVYQSGEIPAVDFDEAVADSRIEIIGEELDRAYIDAVLSRSLSSAREMPTIFSPLHGVGETSVYRILTEAGFTGVEIFEPHRKPDGNFTNVADQSPNPERPQVFEPMIERAKETGAELVLASDPDADRLGISVKHGEGNFVHLTGNRIGALLADYILRKRSAADDLTADHFIVETLVTTPLIGAIGGAHGVRVIDDLLVGFKYIGETMDAEGPEKFVFGAEESLGYLAGDYCRDKDAGIAALYIMESAAELRQEGKTLLDRLDELSVQHGYFWEGQRSEVCTGPQGKEQIQTLMRAFLESPPVELAGIPLAKVRDYNQHEIRTLPDNTKTEDLPRPTGDLLFFESAEADVSFSLAVRPSGTEPKIKFYFFARTQCESPASLGVLKEQTEAKMRDVEDALSDWTAAVLTER